MMLLALLLSGLAPDGGVEPGIDCASDALAQQPMNYCAAREFEAADKALNAQWARTAARMKAFDADYGGAYNDGRPGFYETLLAAQRAWLAYRDGQCTSEGYQFRGGSMEPFMVATCRTRLTKLRTEELRELESVE